MSIQRRGRSVELLVADAFLLAGGRVERGVSLAGHAIDLYVELQAPLNMVRRLAVQVLDRSRPVGPAPVESACMMVQSLRDHHSVDEGFLVSTSGFTPDARRAARKGGIVLLTKDDVNDMISRTGVARYVIPFDSLIREKTQGFVGRQHIFTALDEFLADTVNRSGYFLVTGSPGVGKSAFLAQLVRTRELNIYHFNMALQGLNTPRHFLGNVCARLIMHFDLEYTTLPTDFDLSGSFLNSLLQQASGQVSPDGKLVVAVDAVDEVASAGFLSPNPLMLPSTLPPNVYVVLTARSHLSLPFEAAHMCMLSLDDSSTDNLHDIRAFLEQQADEVDLGGWISRNQITRAEFIDLMVEKSQGNFMYLHHALTAIAQGQVSYAMLAELPSGLSSYYSSLLKRLREQDRETYDRVYRPILCVLAAAREPVSRDLLAQWTQLDVLQVQQALLNLRTFLTTTRGANQEDFHRLFHTSLGTFLKEEIGTDMSTYHAMIAQSALRKIEGEVVDPEHRETR